MNKKHPTKAKLPSFRCIMPVRVKDGKLFFDFSWRGVRCKEYTGLPDTPENWRRCEQKMEAVRRAIARGTFDYRQHFPRGSRLHLFFPDNRIHDGAATRFVDYITKWHKRRSPFLRDGSVGTDAELHPSPWIHDESVIRRHFVPSFGPLRLDEIDVTRCREFRRSLIDAGLGGKTVGNIIGLLHKALNDAVEEGLIERNPVLRASSRKLRSSRRQRLTADPLTPEEIHSFLATVPEAFRDLYSVWFQVGWRSSEIVALRFGWLDFVRKTIVLQRARIPRWGGVEAEPKTGRRLVDCSYAPEIFQTLERIRCARSGVESDDFVFVDSRGRPLSQEWLNKRVWKADAQASGDSRRPVLHRRHVHHAVSLCRRGSGMGCVGMRYLGADDFPPLSELDSRPSNRRWKQNQRGSRLDITVARRSRTVPESVPEST
jgi:integrase